MVDLSRRDLATNEDISAHRLCWADFFKANTWEELTMLANQDPNIAEAVVTIKQLSEEEYIRLCCEAQEDRIRCQNDLLRYHQKELAEHDQKIEERDQKIEELDAEILKLKQQIAELTNP